MPVVFPKSRPIQSAPAKGKAGLCFSRRTKIVATVGPACESPKTMRALLDAGADVLRINTSHTSPDGLRKWIRLIRKVGALRKKEVPILVDLQGPRIRTGPLENKEPLQLRKGQIVSVVPCRQAGWSQGTTVQMTTACLQFQSMVKKGDPVLIDNGLIDLEVLEVQRKEVKCRVLSAGILGENKGINLPNAPITLPALSDKDIGILKIAADLDVDFIALSFVRTPKDMHAVRQRLRRCGKTIPVIAKIEKPMALDHIDAIIETIRNHHFI